MSKKNNQIIDDQTKDNQSVDNQAKNIQITDNQAKDNQKINNQTKDIKTVNNQKSDKNTSKFSKKFIFYLMFFSAAMLVPFVPFLLWGNAMETGIEDWLQTEKVSSNLGWGVIGLLTVDVFLPIPSSVVCTIAGKSLGIFGGTLVSTLGMTLGAFFGMICSRTLGMPLVQLFSSEKDLVEMNRFAQKYGISLLILLRPVPLFAETSLLLLGCLQISFVKTMLMLLPIHCLLALGYAVLGDQLPLGAAMGLSVLIAGSAALFVRLFLNRS